ncbi:hypothetical protein AWB68_08150 [Caballeronia choica]|uniref:Uncharacterized protein n=1 Tax=Caballeronia choica TaxID=326476 RepID=A0A158L076_9BURK|nr:hypothetical protein AWB68_08150 [Caballeronia choica]
MRCRRAGSDRLAEEALSSTLAVRREAVGQQGLFHRVVEHADLADLARFLGGGDLAAELA